MSEDLTQDELVTLKARADQLGVKYHPSIGIEKLREKVAEAMGGTTPATDEPAGEVVETEGQRRKRLKNEASKLVRIRVTCMNPAKREWSGEIFTVGNSMVGSFKKFIPFNADEGWHVPHIMYEALKARECQVFVSGKSKNGTTVRQPSQ